MNKTTLVIFSFLFATTSFGQAAAYSDPAVAYSRLMLESSNPGFYRIGNFKVTGTPYLYGGHETGNIYTESGKIENIKVRYNVYSQELEADGEMGKEKFSIDFSGVDSFILSPSLRVQEKAHFLRSSLFDSTERSFLMVMHRGNSYNLFKKYETSLRYSSTNLGQSDLRVFQLDYEYYYTSPAFYGIKKLKTSKSALKNEFKSKLDMDAFLKQHDIKSSLQRFLADLFTDLNRP